MSPKQQRMPTEKKVPVALGLTDILIAIGDV